jgi:hypothetical protein
MCVCRQTKQNNVHKSLTTPFVFRDLTIDIGRYGLDRIVALETSGLASLRVLPLRWL